MKIKLITILLFFCTSCKLYNSDKTKMDLMFFLKLYNLNSSSTPIAPSITYSSTSNTLTKYLATNLKPTANGSISSCKISPTLPTGLTIEDTTCV
ncbi:MAG: hypothetical protein SFU98_01620, partial [Leptospiraceae bacterium]|nr:hypothetical protein [Leptospiraceae bacterium]